MGSVQLNISKLQLEGMSKKELENTIVEIVNGIRAVCLLLDADAGVTNTNYTSTFDSYITK